MCISVHICIILSCIPEWILLPYPQISDRRTAISRKEGLMMRRSFSNDNGTQVVFTDDGVSFYGSVQEIYYPFGSIDLIRLSLLGVLQVGSKGKICCYVVDRKDRAALRQAMKDTQKAMKDAPKEEAKIFMKNLVMTPGLSPEEQLKKYKTLFVQGTITKDEYDHRRRQLKEE